jgi:hypothetical protein
LVQYSRYFLREKQCRRQSQFRLSQQEVKSSLKYFPPQSPLLHYPQPRQLHQWTTTLTQTARLWPSQSQETIVRNFLMMQTHSEQTLDQMPRTLVS